VPSAPEAYVHRIGRVGRAGREGVAITLAEPREHRQLKTIEKVAGATISVQKVPTVADLRARRLELTRAALRETLLEEDSERFRAVVETLTDEFDLFEVAMAAVKLAHEAGGATDDVEEIPQVAFRPDRPDRPERGGAGRPAGRPSNGQGLGRGGRSSGGPVARLFIGAGRDAGIRPGDLVGAITGETELGGRDIGSIEIHQKFALVEVPESAAEGVVRALRATMIKGRKATVRRDRA
jgi:ATP-dependent RNA helicase DeaD